MKIVINKILILLTITFLVVSCQETGDLTVINPDAQTDAAVSPSVVVLEESNAGTVAMTISWTTPEFGYSAAYNFEVWIDLAGGDFSSAQVISMGKELSKSFETVELNDLLGKLGVEPETPTQLVASVRTILSQNESIDSEDTPFVASAFTAGVYPPLYMIGDALLGWDTALAVEVYGIAPNTTEVVAEFNNGGAFRFFEEPDWGATSYNWTYFEGGNVSPLLESAEDGDTNFRFIGDTGYYKIIVNLATKGIIMEAVAEPTMYMVGAAVPEAGWGWDTPVDMTWVSDGLYEASTEFINDTFRFFPIFGDWGSGRNYPYYINDGYTSDANFDDALDGDNNFRFIGTPGVYTITLDERNKTITLSN